MGIKVSKFVKKKINKSELKEIFKISNIIEEYLNQKEVNKRIQNSNIKGTDSQVIQKIIEEIAVPLGFKDEKKGLFKKYKDSGLRPDFYNKIGKNGILMEVERGKTTTNNMDLLDIYKCHICEEANRLFLFVPIEVSHTKNIYKNVCKKVENFFYEENYLNIDSAIIFGY
jgi:hypothetical protein